MTFGSYGGMYLRLWNKQYCVVYPTAAIVAVGLTGYELEACKDF